MSATSSSSDFEDRELLRGIAGRDPEAFRALMERYAAPVINLAYRFVGTQHDAEEIAQDVFLRLYQHPPLLQTSKLFTWLYRVTVNRCLDFLRSRSRRPQTISLDSTLEAEPEGTPLSERISDPSSKTPQEKVIETEMVTLTRKAVATLPFSLKACLLLATIEELSHQEIARILRISPKAVERRLSRARELLKTRLAAYL